VSQEKVSAPLAYLVLKSVLVLDGVETVARRGAAGVFQMRMFDIRAVSDR
jgi:hypothetical protein